MKTKFEIIKTRGRWGEYNYDLKTESFRRRIYKPESSAPYILLDDVEISLPPEMRKQLTTIMEDSNENEQ